MKKKIILLILILFGLQTNAFFDSPFYQTIIYDQNIDDINVAKQCVGTNGLAANGVCYPFSAGTIGGDLNQYDANIWYIKVTDTNKAGRINATAISDWNTNASLLYASIANPPAIPVIAGNNTQIQYNSSGVLGASQFFTFADANKALSLNGLEIFKANGYQNFQYNAFTYEISNWSNQTKTHFDTGTYLNTDYNSLDSNGYVGLTLGNNSGDYNSKIFDVGSGATWQTLSWNYKKFNCPTGMSFIPKLGGFCIDQYEASHSDATFCDNDRNWTNDCSTKYGSSAIPASVPNRIPWVNISLYDANTACTAAGKKLCNSKEWMAAANLNGQTCDLSNVTTQTTCIVDSTKDCRTAISSGGHSASVGYACNTGSNKDTNAPSNCKSSQSVFDLIGNVWEWTSDIVDVNTTSLNGGWQYPNDSTNPPLWGNTTPSSHYGNDGVYTSATKIGRGVLRGGGWSYGSRAGFFCVYLSNAPTAPSNGNGFRCCVKP